MINDYSDSNRIDCSLAFPWTLTLANPMLHCAQFKHSFQLFLCYNSSLTETTKFYDKNHAKSSQSMRYCAILPFLLIFSEFSQNFNENNSISMLYDETQRHNHPVSNHKWDWFWWSFWQHSTLLRTQTQWWLTCICTKSPNGIEMATMNIGLRCAYCWYAWAMTISYAI